jgi:hypothetical protein
MTASGEAMRRSSLSPLHSETVRLVIVVHFTLLALEMDFFCVS